MAGCCTHATARAAVASAVRGTEVRETVDTGHDVSHVPRLSGLHRATTVHATHEVTTGYQRAKDLPYLAGKTEVLGRAVVGAHGAHQRFAGSGAIAESSRVIAPRSALVRRPRARCHASMNSARSTSVSARSEVMTRTGWRRALALRTMRARPVLDMCRIVTPPVPFYAALHSSCALRAGWAAGGNGSPHMEHSRG